MLNVSTSPDASLKRKISDSSKKTFKERKRSPTPQRMSDWEFIRMRDEIATYKMEISKLESRLLKQGEMRVESELAAAKRIKQLETERGSDRAELKQLHYMIERLRQTVNEQEEQLNKTCKFAESEKSQAEAKTNAAQAEVIKLKDKLREVEEEKEQLIEQVTSLKSEAVKTANDLEEEKLRFAKMEFSFRTKARDSLYAQKDFEKRAVTAERMVQELTHERDFLSESLKEARSTSTWVLKKAELENELKKVKSEAKTLRDAVKEKFLVEECNHGLQEKITHLEGLLKNSAELEVAKKELLGKLEEWQIFAGSLCEAAGIIKEENKLERDKGTLFNLTTTRKALNRMQIKEAELTSDLLEAQSRLKELQSRCAQTTLGSENLTAQVNALTKEKAEVISHLHMIRRKLQIVTQERDTYRQLVDSMEQEMTFSGPMFHAAASGSSPQKRLAAGGKGNARSEELERLIDKYQKSMELLEAELSEEKKKRKIAEETKGNVALGKLSEEDVLNRIKDAVGEERKRLEREIEVIWQKKEAALKEVEELKARIDQLEGEIEHRALKGDFNIANTKVLHFKMNPTSLATEKYEDDLQTCRSECERLRERVKVLEEKKKVLRAQIQSGDIATIPTDEEAMSSGDASYLEVTKVVEQRIQAQGSKELQDLREQLRSSKMLPERLKEAFKVKIKDFRDACYNLFGYKLKLVGQGRWSISSMYAESPDDELLFEISSSGAPSLLETPFSATLGDLISVHLMHLNSIPAFLSALTIELVNRQTIA